jgi:hypothetical protein
MHAVPLREKIEKIKAREKSEERDNGNWQCGRSVRKRSVSYSSVE